jgi:hypothetical protein
MKKQLFLRLSGLSLVALAFGALASSTSAAGGGGGINCPDVWNPVICSNGNIYSNQCYANLAKAKNCVPWGDD